MAEEVSQLAATVAREKSAIRRAALAGALDLWNDIVGNPSNDAYTAFVAAYGPEHPAAGMSAAQLVDAFIDAFLDAHGVEPVGAGVDPEAIVARSRAGTGVDELLERPFKTARMALADGVAFDAAMDQARRRLENIVATDVQQSFRLAFAERMGQEPQLHAYRRVLAGPENCSLCVVASTQRYRSDKLMPIHPGCDCSVEPLAPGTKLRGAIIEDGVPRLDAAKQIIREQGLSYTDRAGMANLKIDTDSLDAIAEFQHGELGPVLKVSRHRSETLPWQRRTRREFDDTGRLIRSGPLGPSRT